VYAREKLEKGYGWFGGKERTGRERARAIATGTMERRFLIRNEK